MIQYLNGLVRLPQWRILVPPKISGAFLLYLAIEFQHQHLRRVSINLEAHKKQQTNNK